MFFFKPEKTKGNQKFQENQIHTKNVQVIHSLREKMKQHGFE